MAKLSKRMQNSREKLVADKVYSIDEGFELLQQLSSIKFKESVDVSINLGVDPRKSEQGIRGATVLPHGTGKSVKVVVFAQAANAVAAEEAGADIVGFEELAEQIKQGFLDFDVVIATPDSMRVVGKLGQILGPRGLMPNPKVGTVTTDVGTAVKNAKAGQVRYRTDKSGIIHCIIGKVDFATDSIKENLQALLTDLKKARPSAVKGIYMQKISLSTTMGVGLMIDLSSLSF